MKYENGGTNRRRGPLQHFRKSLVGNAVEDRTGRRGYGFVPMLTKLFDQLRSNEPGTANYYDFHDCLFVVNPHNSKLPAFR
jgi:hypothetical protein